MKRLVGLSALLLANACTMGPKHVVPMASLPPTPAAAGSTAPVNSVAGPDQTFQEGGTTPNDWWRSFGNDTLNALVDQALKANEDIKVADATLRQAQENGRAIGGQAFPQVDASLTSERARTSAAYSNPLQDPNQYLYTLHTAQVSVSYPLDIFGGVRSRIRSAQAAAQSQGFKLRAARQTVVANLVNAVIARASLAAQIDAARASISVNQDLLRILQRRQQLGDLGLSDVSTQQTALASAEAALPALVRSEARERALIATLIGVSPGNPIPALPDLAELTLPGTLPVALPSDLIHRRPDILAAEAQLRGAGADVGSAIAARLPQITLSANAGGTSQDFGRMFADGNPFWQLLGSIAQPIFHGGQLLHQQRAAEAALDGAKAQYRGAVLQAFADVSDALTGLHTDAAALDAADRASRAASTSLGYVRRQLALGGAGTLQLLNATSADAQARAQLLQARAARLSDTVALYQATGGGIDGAR